VWFGQLVLLGMVVEPVTLMVVVVAGQVVQLMLEQKSWFGVVMLMVSLFVEVLTLVVLLVLLASMFGLD
jgi:ABC-type glutathione transport system ATPase component